MTGPQNTGDHGNYGPQSQPGPYPQPGYQPQYPPQYPPQYQPPPQQYGPPGYGYPPPPPTAMAGARVSVQWTGGLMLIGGAMLVLGSFLDWVKLSVRGLHLSITGLGSLSGDEAFKDVVNSSKVTDGKVTLTFGILLVIGAIIILARQGRIWVGIVGTVLSAISLIIALADVGQASDANDRYKTEGLAAHLAVQIGLVITLVGSIVALAFSIVAICVRRRQV